MSTKTLLVSFGALLGSLLFTPIAHGQIVINEYSASNTSTATDNYGEYEDWVELYNPNGSAFDLSSYYLSDKATNITKWQIPAGVTVPANGRLLIYFSGRGEFTGGILHAGMKLSQTKPEDIIVADMAGMIIDQVTMDPAQENHSRGRTTDGDANWSLFTTPTPGAANSNPQIDYTPRPVFDVASGAQTGAVTLNITTIDPSATIYYTTDGSTPTTGSTVVSGPVNVPATAVIRARAFSSTPNLLPSFVETNTYLINENHTVPVMAIAGDQLGDLLGGNGGIKPQGHFEYFDINGVLADEAYGEFNEHGNDSWAYDQRGFDYITRDQFGYNYAVQHQIFNRKNRDKFQRLIVKAAANDNISFENGAHIRDAYIHDLSQKADLRMDERTSEFCVLYVNGQYWGVYDVREKVDDLDFTDYYYDQGAGQVDFIKTWGGTWSEYGDQTDWTDLYNFIMTNDMSDPVMYQQAKSRYNTGSLIDYVVLNSYVVSKDWLNWNTAWWRGKNPNGDKKKYRYALWDMDATFGHYVNYTGIPDESPQADPCNVETLSGSSDPEGHIQLLNKLMDSPEFQQDYISRYIDLGNSYFSCAYMQAHLDSMVAVIEPEMQRQVNRWGGTFAQWQGNVTTMKDFISARCAAINNGLIGCYTLTGPYPITLDVMPMGAGEIKMNSLDLTNFLWTGEYFGGIDLELTAKAYAGWEFDYWESATVMSPALDSAEVTTDVAGPDNIIAHFRMEGDTATTPPIQAIGEHIITVPNAFTPNGDGWNDYMQVIASNDILNFEFIVFDRWGKVMFRTTALENRWNGTYSGTLLNSGVFTYTLTALFEDGFRISKGGNITLMR